MYSDVHYQQVIELVRESDDEVPIIIIYKLLVFKWVSILACPIPEISHEAGVTESETLVRKRSGTYQWSTYQCTPLDMTDAACIWARSENYLYFNYIVQKH